jgi:hypothetical protein
MAVDYSKGTVARLRDLMDAAESDKPVEYNI